MRTYRNFLKRMDGKSQPKFRFLLTLTKTAEDIRHNKRRILATDRPKLHIVPT